MIREPPAYAAHRRSRDCASPRSDVFCKFGAECLGRRSTGAEMGRDRRERRNDEEINGVKLVDWVDALVAGSPLDDVHCIECTARHAPAR